MSINSLLQEPVSPLDRDVTISGSPRGPSPASVMVVGEAFGTNEKKEGVPFVGSSGRELVRMLEQAGFAADNIRFTNVVNERPPNNDISKWFYSSKKKASDAGASEVAGKYPKEIVKLGVEQLQAEIEATAPELILAFGNTALWALTGQWGITKWRGSRMDCRGGPVGDYPITVIPTYHPAAILRQWSWRHIAVHDLRYAAANIPAPIPEPDWNFILRPGFEEAKQFLNWITAYANEHRLRISADVETRGGQISCIGFATDDTTAICLPFLSTSSPDGSYWSLEEETEIVLCARRILTHPNIEVVWQNGAYDVQYILHCWRFIPNVTHDTMLMQHAAFPGALPKGLDFLASMYCHYRYYWKDEGKEWNPRIHSEDRHWRYNCLDCCRTLEVAPVLLDTLDKLGLRHIYQHSMSLYEPTLFMMLNGVAIDREERNRQTQLLFEEMNRVEAWINYVVGDELNVQSSPQMKKLFYDQIGLPVIRHKKTKQPTLDEGALTQIGKKHPLLSPLTDRILALRSAGVFMGTFLKARLGRDQRMHCQYDIAGTETGRFASRKDAFGNGTNLENIPRPRDQDETTPIVRFPNVRHLFVPDPGHIIADFDLDRADAHIVAWEAGAEALKQLFREGVDVHLANAMVLRGEKLPPLEELHPDHPKYESWLKPRKIGRQFAKNFVHGADYGGSDRTLASVTGNSLSATKTAMNTWFSEHPEIKEWHEETEMQLMRERRITTVFGRTRHYFDRIDHNIVHEALAYKGQSPVADIINKGLRNVYDNLHWCQILLQNHDSIVVQLPADCQKERLEEIRQQLLVPVPYEDPLTIPVGYKVSSESWGLVK